VTRTPMEDAPPARAHYDLHGLIRLDLSGPNAPLLEALDRSLSSFRADGEGGDLSLNLGAYPSPQWVPKGSTVGDRMLYDPEAEYTTVFNKVMGNEIRMRDVQYVIKGRPRVGTGPVAISVPDNSARVGRIKRAAVESLDLEGRRAILALAGDQLFSKEKIEQDAEGILQTLLEPFLYYRLAKHGCTFVHGSGLSSGGSGFLIVGLASVGKTSMALQFVKKGYVYYGDDLPIVSAGGELLSNPKPIKLRSQHIDLYPELASRLTRQMSPLERTLLTRKVRGHKPDVMKRLPRLAIEEIFEGSKIGGRATLKTVFFLRRMAGNEFYVDELDKESLVRAVAADLFFQFPCAPWRRTMYYFCPSVALGNDFMAEEDQHHHRVAEILNGAFAKAKIVRLNAPIEASSAELVRQIEKFLP
jgi:hypothetical protein